jgi:hypothetical protein
MMGSIEPLLARREKIRAEVSCLWMMSVKNIPKCLEIEITYISEFLMKIEI